MVYPYIPQMGEFADATKKPLVLSQFARADIKNMAHLPSANGVGVALHILGHIHAQLDSCKRRDALGQHSVSIGIQPLRVAKNAVDLRGAVRCICSNCLRCLLVLMKPARAANFKTLYSTLS
jgi:hypothetical protein